MRYLFNRYKNQEKPPAEKDITSLYESFQPILVLKPHIVAFQSKEMEKIMPEIKILLIDGTFEAAPFPFYQLLNFMGITNNGTCFINIFHVLIEGKSEQHYNDAILHCSSLLLKIRPKMIITDFEPALINSLKHIYPEFAAGMQNVKYINCYFHYCQLLKKHYESLYGKDKNKNSIKRYIYKMARHLPFVSDEDQNEFFQMISKNYGDGKKFVEYLLGNWGTKDLKKWREENAMTHVITQCALEGFHHLLNKEFKTRPSMEMLAKALFKLDERMIITHEAKSLLEEGFKSKGKDNGSHILSFAKAKDSFLKLINTK